MTVAKKSIPANPDIPPIDTVGLVDNLHLQIAILKAEKDDLRTERNLYKKLFEEEISLHFSRGRKGKKSPTFLRWLQERSDRVR
jgi:hypothetical protein